MKNKLSIVADGIFYSKEIQIPENLSTEKYLDKIFKQLALASEKLECFFYNENASPEGFLYYWDNKLNEKYTGSHSELFTYSFYPTFLDLHFNQSISESSESITINFLQYNIENNYFGLMLSKEISNFIPLRDKNAAEIFLKFLSDSLGITVFGPENKFKTYLGPGGTVTNLDGEIFHISDFMCQYFDYLIRYSYEMLDLEIVDDPEIEIAICSLAEGFKLVNEEHNSTLFNVNNPLFEVNYPFDKSFDEVTIDVVQWAKDTTSIDSDQYPNANEIKKDRLFTGLSMIIDNCDFFINLGLININTEQIYFSESSSYPFNDILVSSCEDIKAWADNWRSALTDRWYYLGRT